MTRWMSRLHADPVPWLLEHGCAPIRYRTLTEIAGRDPNDAECRAAREACGIYPPSLKVQQEQQRSGLWLDKLLHFEPPNKNRRRGPGFFNQVLFLVERGWDRQDPVIHLAESEWLSPLAASASGVDLCEMKGFAGGSPQALLRVRAMLAEIAAAVLARAGFQGAPCVQSVAQRVTSDLARHCAEDGAGRFEGITELPDEEVAYRRLNDDWCTPDMFLFYLLAFDPAARSAAAKNGGLAWLGRQLGQVDSIPRRAREVTGRRALRLKDLHINVFRKEEFASGKLGYLLHDLELLARTGLLTEVPAAVELLEWVLSLRIAPEAGFFDIERCVERNATRSQYHYFPLEESWRGTHRKFTDVVFRLTLILTHLDQGRR